MNIKILNEKHNILVQMELFKLGYKWFNGQKVNQSLLKFITINSSKRLFFCDVPSGETIRLKDLRTLEQWEKYNEKRKNW